MKTNYSNREQFLNRTGLVLLSLVVVFPCAVFAQHKSQPRTPHQAAQLGINWLQIASLDWQKQNQCFGCHTQAQVIMGLVVAKKNNYSVNDKALADLVAFTRSTQSDAGTFHSGNYLTATQFAAMAIAYYDELKEQRSGNLTKSVNWLLAHQKPSGELALDHDEPPIDQGSMMTTANSVFAFLQAYKETGNGRYQKAARRALAWIASAKPDTTQDKVFKVLALSAHGNEAQRQLVPSLITRLKTEQRKDGGWKESKATNGSNAFATGQVLYALKKAGEDIDSPEFRRGVHYLLTAQRPDGSWPSMNSQSGRPSSFAPTMWAVIGLAGTIVKAAAPVITKEVDRIRITLDSAILFDFNHSELRAESETALAEIKASYLDKYPDAKILIEGYTDNIGSDAHNLTLSENRAQSVAVWMGHAGIETSRIDAKGLGRDNPRFPNTNDENRARNRRVEISVLTGNEQ
jgi:outer membrane protein OmpA-like peptidoglycan-associated protein